MRPFMVRSNESLGPIICGIQATFATREDQGVPHRTVYSVHLLFLYVAIIGSAITSLRSSKVGRHVGVRLVSALTMVKIGNVSFFLYSVCLADHAKLLFVICVLVDQVVIPLRLGLSVISPLSVSYVYVVHVPLGVVVIRVNNRVARVCVVPRGNVRNLLFSSYRNLFIRLRLSLSLSCRVNNVL